MTVRLVKGAYWDSEIKRAQERGLDGYPVYTRKVTTDVSYLACVGRLFKHADVIYPQFATHNAHSIAVGAGARAARTQTTNFNGCTAWAGCCMPRLRGRSQISRGCACMRPVGEHKDLLAYLVRRLLENGANTSFVNRFMDEQVPVAEIVRDPISELERLESYAHPRLPVPAALYSDRRNSRGIDLGDPRELEKLRGGDFDHASHGDPADALTAGPIINGRLLAGNNACRDQSGGSARSGGQHARRDPRGNNAGVRCRRRGSIRVELKRRRDARALPGKGLGSARVGPCGISRAVGA